MATGNKLMKEISDQFLHCKICYEPYKEPKTLVCLHTFCTQCIQQHVDSDGNRSSRFLLYNRYVTCPLCRKKTEIPSGGIRRLPDNFLVSSLTDIIDRKRPCKIPPCEICLKDKPRGNEACSKCLDCVKLLCKSCVELHLTTKVTRNHSLIDIEGEKDIQCKTHPEETVRFYCEPCDECICVVCTFQEHMDHEICSFTDGFAKYKDTLDGLLGQCKDRLEDVKGRMNVINQCEYTLKETRENIRDLAINYISQVRQTEKQLLHKVESEFGDEVNALVQNKEWLQENLEGLQSTCNLAEIIIKDKGIDMLLVKKELQNKLSALMEPALPPVPENLTRDIKCVPGSVKLGYLSVLTDNPTDIGDGFSKHHGQKPLCNGTGNSLMSRPDVINSPPVWAEMNFVTQNGDLIQNGQPENGHSVAVDIRRSVADMVDKGLQVFSDVGTISSGICVQCCAELKKDLSKSTGSLPIVDGNPPAVEEIIILNTDENSDRTKRRRRRSLIRSRRVQTEVSLSTEDCSQDDVFLRVSSQESLGSFRKSSSMRSLDSVSEPARYVSVGLDPIDPLGLWKKPETKTASSNTSLPVKLVVDTRSTVTNTDKVETRDAIMITYPQRRAFETQTPGSITAHKGVATDYTGQRNKTTSTPIKNFIDSGTCMPTITHESKVTWTDAVSTAERSVSTELNETCERGTEMVQKVYIDQGQSAKPEVRSMDTNTTITGEIELIGTAKAATTEGATAEKEKKAVKKEKDKSKEKVKKDKSKKKETKKEKRVFAEASTETDPTVLCDKETGTVKVPFRDQWTATASPVYVNTGISPARPATIEAAVSTNPVSHMDQATYTDVVQLRHTQTETVTIIADSETLTERINVQDAQTSVDVTTETAEINTDSVSTTETGITTDDDWMHQFNQETSSTSTETVSVLNCETCKNMAKKKMVDRGSTVSLDPKNDFKRRKNDKVYVDTASSPIPTITNDRGTMVLGVAKHSNLVDCDTQTSLIATVDKSVVTSCDLDDDNDGFRGLAYCEAATSTESLPYIGLLSDMDCDELILVPEVAFDLIPDDQEYMGHVPLPMVDGESQTIISSAYMSIDQFSAHEAEWGPELLPPKPEFLIDVGVNTVPKLTFEKETSTPIRYLYSKGTMTSFIARTDKSTSTGSHVREMAENVFGSKSPKVGKSSPAVEKKDVCVTTDSSLLDEKMIACINKLKNVSERLNSPTGKTTTEVLPWTKKSDNEINDAEERKKNVMDLIAQSKAILKPKESGCQRKAQPITTLKGKYLEAPQEELKTQSLPRTDHSGNVKMGSKVNPQTLELPRNNSAPGRITTVPKGKGQGSPKVQSKIPIKNRNSDNLSLPSSMSSPGAEFYSTVPKTRHQRMPLPVITETKSPSTCSDSSNTSFVSANSGQSSTSMSSADKALDLSAFKIKSPPDAFSGSGGARPKTNSKAPPAISTTIEVIPTIDIIPEPHMRTESSSSEQDAQDQHPEKKGFMKRIFGSKKKKSADKEKRNRSPSKSPKPQRKAPSTPQPLPPPVYGPMPTPEQKKMKPKPFVYMRSRIFSIEQENEEKYRKETESKYCISKPKEEEVFVPPDFAATFKKK